MPANWLPIDSAPENEFVFIRYDDGEILAYDDGKPMRAIWFTDQVRSLDKTDGEEWWCRSGIEAGGIVTEWCRELDG